MRMLISIQNFACIQLNRWLESLDLKGFTFHML